MKNAPSWDLSDLFKSDSDPRIETLLAKEKKRAVAFARRYRGSVGKGKLSPRNLSACLSTYENILSESAKPYEFAYLQFCESCTEKNRGAFLQKMRASILEIQNALIFVEIELSQLPEKLLRSYRNSPYLASYRNYLTKSLDGRSYRLSEKEEKILSERSLTGRASWLRFFDEEIAAKKFPYTIKGKTSFLTETDTLNLLYHPDRAVRKAGAHALSQGLQEEGRRLSFIFNTLGEDKAVEDRLRKFSDPEDARHLANEIDRATVDSMVGAVVAGYPIVTKYYGLKKKLLKLPSLMDYDRYAPITKKESKIPFKTAERWILDAFSAFSPEYAAIAKLFFDKRWIDAASREGKRGGGFCAYTSPDLHPYVFLNYSGSLRDVFTLAHELGHGIHMYLSRGVGYLNSDTPLTVAETASLFAEMLLLSYLKSGVLPAEELLPLYISRIESSFATVFRQVAMHRFEQDFHRERRLQGELPLERINELWIARQNEMFRGSVTLSEGYAYWWSYIPHFLKTPFYVYAYAFGELLTLSLFSLYKKGTPHFVENYLELLSAGASKSPQELVAPLKVKLSSREFWDGGISFIKDLVRECEGLQSR